MGDDASQLRNDGNSGRSVKGKKRGNRRGGDAEGSDERSARVKTTTWRGPPSSHDTSDSDAAEGGERSRRAGKNSDADAPDGGSTGKAKESREPDKRGGSRRRASRERNPQHRGEAKAVAGGSIGAAAVAVPQSRRRSSVSTTGDSRAVGDKRKGGKRLPSTNSETAKGESVKNDNSGGNGRRSQPTKRANNNNNADDGRKDGGGRRRRTSSGLSTSREGSSSLPSSPSLAQSRENSSRENAEETSQARSSTGQKGRHKRRQSLGEKEQDEGRGGHPAGGKAAPRTTNQGARRSVVAVGDDETAIPDVGSTAGERSGKSGTSRGGGSGRRTSKGREGNDKGKPTVPEMDEVSGGWIGVVLIARKNYPRDRLSGDFKGDGTDANRRTPCYSYSATLARNSGRRTFF